MKKNSRRFSRRRFLTIGSLGAVGVWAGCSDQLGARMVRGLMAETGRTVLKPKFTPNPQLWDPSGVTAAWLGHSTVLVNFYGLTILTDPVLGKRVGADTWVGTIGAKRLIAPALRARQLPPIDLVLLSHAHMDHLDPVTLRRLPGAPQTVTAHATADLLCGSPLKTPETLAWGGQRESPPHTATSMCGPLKSTIGERAGNWTLTAATTATCSSAKARK